MKGLVIITNVLRICAIKLIWASLSINIFIDTGISLPQYETQLTYII